MATYSELWAVWVMVEEKALRRLPELYIAKVDAQQAASRIIAARNIDERLFAIAPYGKKDIVGGEGLEGMSW